MLVITHENACEHSLLLPQSGKQFHGGWELATVPDVPFPAGQPSWLRAWCTLQLAALLFPAPLLRAPVSGQYPCTPLISGLMGRGADGREQGWGKTAEMRQAVILVFYSIQVGNEPLGIEAPPPTAPQFSAEQEAGGESPFPRLAPTSCPMEQGLAGAWRCGHMGV